MAVVSRFRDFPKDLSLVASRLARCYDILRASELRWFNICTLISKVTTTMTIANMIHIVCAVGQRLHVILTDDLDTKVTGLYTVGACLSHTD